MTQTSDAALRQHVRALLTDRQAHLMFGDVVEDFPLARMNDRLDALPYSAFEVLWHLRFTQRDILNFVRDGPYEEVEWPQGYWPHRQDATEAEWHAETAAFHADLAALLELLDDPRTDLFAVVPNGRPPEGEGQTWLREFLLVADHNAYHLGELLVLRRLLGGA
jgi:uncharacterized damage-inducible protein DinB